MKKWVSLLSLLLMVALVLPGIREAQARDGERENSERTYRNSGWNANLVAAQSDDDDSDDDDSDDDDRPRVRRDGLAVKKHRRAMAGKPVTEDCLKCHADWAAEQPPVEQPPVEQPPVEQPPVEQPPVEQPPVEQPPVAVDSDGDGVADELDSCQNTPANELANANGCSASQLDSDSDGVSDARDLCPGTPAGDAADANGCGNSQVDSDNDGVTDANDACANSPFGEQVDAGGCSASQLDSDNDGVNNAQDQCPNTAAGVEVDAVGCEVVAAPSILKAPATTLCRSCHGFKDPANYSHSSLQSRHGNNCSTCHNF
ncbi:hypothetical protein DESUT3_26340 [Desulfuromonas versatilis]|uniref:Uncharacterized protein n=1 Tax=Desulfuromonas versatilis TaxID=2802975 RepID=A0ABM8HUF9_9BACT|nr:thrombospondin type 3 repeat-containing protein [Desulfuromonas versatilis]BCR05565.1 hypothetical protein DESUT3_26340 [Desulfuromonas versatilis]